jgi:hypothetical protein
MNPPGLPYARILPVKETTRTIPVFALTPIDA